LASSRRRAPPSSSVPADLLPVQRAPTASFRLARLVGIPLLNLLFRIRTEGRERIPRQGAYVVIANHLGWLDSFLILSAFPSEPRIHFLGNPSGLSARRLQWWTVRQVGGFIPVDRARQGNQQLFEHVDRCLERGGAVALYPEGEYGRQEGRLLPFRKGFAHFAIDHKVPIVPVGLSGTHELWLRKSVLLRIGDPIATRGQTVEGLLPLARARVQALLHELPPEPGPHLLADRLTRLF
jgi:1-acyl-sn-glycerol-3-phosphate acyltransferase